MDLKAVVVVEDTGSETPARPAALEDVGNVPIACHVIDLVATAGAQEIIVACSAKHAAQVVACTARRKSSQPNLRFVHGFSPIDLIAGLKLAAPLVGEAACIVHLASGLLDEPIGPLLGQLSDGRPDVVVLVHQAPTPQEHLNGATLRMLRIAELDPERAGVAMTGVWLFGPQAMSLMQALPSRVNPEVDLTVMGEQVAAAGGSFQVRMADSWCRYAGDTGDLLELNRMVLDAMASEPRRPDVNGNSIQGRVWIDASADVCSSVIVGPAVIGPGARVQDAYIGPYTSVGARARIEGAEVERSIIAAGASILHVGGRLVASVLGQDARIFRDFSLPRAMRLRVGDGTEVALC